MRKLIKGIEKNEWRKLILNIPKLKNEIGTCRESKGDGETMVNTYEEKMISSYKLDLLWKDQWPLALVPSVDNNWFWRNEHYILVITIIEQDKALILAILKNPTFSKIQKAALTPIEEESKIIKDEY